MKIKRIILIITLLFLTGCSATYNLNISEEGIKEVIEGTVTNNELDNTGHTDANVFVYNLESRTPLIRDEGSYSKNITNKDNYKKFTYTYSYDGNYDKSSALNICFDNPMFDESEEYYYVELKSPFNCLYSDKLTINITSDYEVISNNADKVHNNTYTWIINDKDNVNISLTISKKLSYQKNEYEVSFTRLRIIGFIVLIILSIITYLLYRKKNSNKV